MLGFHPGLLRSTSLLHLGLVDSLLASLGAVQMQTSHKPWVGSRYSDSSVRIAILGYSHHRSEKECDYDNFTIDTVNEFIADPASEHNFSDRFACISMDPIVRNSGMA